MISAVIAKVGLSDYFPDSQILGLDDPGPGIQADKGSELSAALDALDFDVSMDQCIFLDDKLGNLNWANCEGTDADGDSCSDYGGTRQICDTLLIQEREGMDGTDMNYVEARGILPATSSTDCDNMGGVFVANSVTILAFVFISSVVYIAFC